ncbi:unnamed protein product [Dicrocoelium dendriticum]|nr:unnamed protein product [Dicrocoelium dendriticum]
MSMLPASVLVNAIPCCSYCFTSFVECLSTQIFASNSAFTALWLAILLHIDVFTLLTDLHMPIGRIQLRSCTPVPMLLRTASSTLAQNSIDMEPPYEDVLSLIR